jgi:hypothetical protein
MTCSSLLDYAYVHKSQKSESIVIFNISNRISKDYGEKFIMQIYIYIGIHVYIIIKFTHNDFDFYPISI